MFVFRFVVLSVLAFELKGLTLFHGTNKHELRAEPE